MKSQLSAQSHSVLWERCARFFPHFGQVIYAPARRYYRSRACRPKTVRPCFRSDPLLASKRAGKQQMPYTIVSASISGHRSVVPHQRGGKSKLGKECRSCMFRECVRYKDYENKTVISPNSRIRPRSVLPWFQECDFRSPRSSPGMVASCQVFNIKGLDLT
jgi:hypothetical protein